MQRLKVNKVDLGTVESLPWYWQEEQVLFRHALSQRDQWVFAFLVW